MLSREDKSAFMMQQKWRQCDVTGRGGHMGHFCLLRVSPSEGRGTIAGSVFLTSCRCGSASAATYFLLFSSFHCPYPSISAFLCLFPSCPPFMGTRCCFFAAEGPLRFLELGGSLTGALTSPSRPLLHSSLAE